MTLIISSIKNNNSLHLYSDFLGTQSALHCQMVSPHPPAVQLVDDRYTLLFRNYIIIHIIYYVI